MTSRVGTGKSLTFFTVQQVGQAIVPVSGTILSCQAEHTELVFLNLLRSPGIDS